TNIDLLDCVVEGYSSAHNSLFKRIEIHEDHVNRFNALLLHRFDVFRLVSQAKQSAMDLRMQRLDAAVHHLGKSRHVRDIEHIDSAITESLCRPSGADDLNAKPFQLGREINDTGFVRNTNQCPPNLY